VLPLILAVLVVVSLPYWLPRLVVTLRMWIFARINGDEGVPIPGPLVDVRHFTRIYSDPAADGRSEGARLSDLFWYWLAPGPEVHQEHLEPGERYDDVARTTRRILARPKPDVERLAAACAARTLDATRPGLVRLRDLMMPVWAELYYELVFQRPCPPAARDLIVGNANDVVTALKCCGLRHMSRRERLTAYLREHLDEIPHALPASLSREEQVFYLQGTFFNTAVVQMSEAMAHLLMAIARHPEVQHRLASEPGDDAYLDHVINESLRRYPLFGIAHRITSKQLTVDERTTLPAGSVLCFDYPAFHMTGYDDPGRFDPDRWRTLPVRKANHLPFGVTANRACPAKGVAPLTMRVVARETLRRFAVHSSAAHTRSMPNRGPCVLVAREDDRALRIRLALLRLRDRWEDVWRSLVQLGLGTYMVWDARRSRPAARYFAEATR
jgi:hypothetical protein